MQEVQSNPVGDSQTQASDAPAEAPVGNSLLNMPIESAKPSEWKWNDKMAGEGEVPEWFDHQAYGSIADQAAAAKSLRSQLSEFKAAPDSYAIDVAPDLGTQMNEAGLELNGDNPLVTQFTEIAKKSNLSQEAFTEILNLYAHSALQETNLSQEEVKDYQTEQLKLLGDNGTQLIGEIDQWGRNVLPEDMYETFAQMNNSAQGIKLFQHLRDMMKQEPVPQEQTHSPISDNEHKLKLKAMLNDRRYKNNSDFQRMVNDEYNKFYGKQFG